ncbi:MAG TPA: DUF917 domain-containing protein [Alphaproteobacteria bacterium]|nr:DUF917 domain-containing protein [Alphaproteobacteria bacterium]
MSGLAPVTEEDLKSLALGAGILGTGGGTHPYLELLNIEKLYLQGRRVSLLSPDALGDDELVAEVGFMGAPLVTKERLPDPEQILKAYRMMERYARCTFRAVMTSEIGGENAILPFFVAALTGLPVLDADPRGRAFPEMQMSTFAIAGLPLFPVALADIRSNEVLVLRTVGPKWTERIGRGICTEAGAMLATCRPPRTGGQIKSHALHGSVSRAIRLGAAVRRARREHRDPADTVLEVERGLKLFTGKVIDVARRTTEGFVRGQAHVEGSEDHAGRLFKVDFQNEFTIGWIDGRLAAVVPDLICILDALTGEAIGTETIRYGQRVRILSLPASRLLTSARALEIVGPRAFGYDLDFVSAHIEGHA